MFVCLIDRQGWVAFFMNSSLTKAVVQGGTSHVELLLPSAERSRHLQVNFI